MRSLLDCRYDGYYQAGQGGYIGLRAVARLSLAGLADDFVVALQWVGRFPTEVTIDPIRVSAV